KNIYNSRFKDLPSDFQEMTGAEAKAESQNSLASPFLPKQEAGIRSSSALNYEIYVNGSISKKKKHFDLSMEASNALFGKDALGAPFTVYAPGGYLNSQSKKYESGGNWAFAVKAGSRLDFSWPLENFENGLYHLQ